MRKRKSPVFVCKGFVVSDGHDAADALPLELGAVGVVGGPGTPRERAVDATARDRRGTRCRGRPDPPGLQRDRTGIHLARGRR